MSTYIPIVNEFGETRGYRFKQVREIEGLSIRWISKQTGIPREKLEQMERDEIPFPPDALFKLSKLFNSTAWV
jgi:predicted transcriptional regulator